MKKATKEMFRNQNRVNPRQQANQEMERQIGEFQKNLAGMKPLFPVKVNKLPGDLNYLIKNETAACNLHSLYDREREMQAIFEQVDKDTEVLVLFGFGCAMPSNMPPIIFRN